MEPGYNDLRDSLMQLAYQFYPYNMVEYYDEMYYETKEYKKLKKARENFDNLNKNWNELISAIRSYYSQGKYEIEDWIETAPSDRCFVGRLIIRPEDHSILPQVLVFNISFITPLFSIYQSKITWRSFCIPRDLELLYQQLCLFIKNAFPDHTELPAELASIELDGICFEGIGKLDYMESDVLKKMTIFDAFFSGSFY